MSLTRPIGQRNFRVPAAGYRLVALGWINEFEMIKNEREFGQSKERSFPLPLPLMKLEPELRDDDGGISDHRLSEA